MSFHYITMFQRSASLLRATCVAFALLGMLMSRAGWCADVAVVRSDRNFDETAQQLEWVFGGYGLTTVTALDYQQILRGIKVPIGRAVLLEVMRLEWLKVLMTQDPLLGSALPVRIQVYEDASGVVFVTYRSPGAELQTHEQERVRALGRQIDEKLGAIVMQATRVPRGERDE